MATYHIQLFGKIYIERDDVDISNIPAKAQELLCYLLLHPTQPHTREFLAGELWADATVAQSKKYLRQNLWHLQTALEPTEAGTARVLLLEHDWIQVNPAASLWLDVRQFEQTFALIRPLGGSALSLQQAQKAHAAAQLYRGDLLMGWYQDWCLLERARLQLMLFALLDKLMDRCLAYGQLEDGIEYGHQLLRYDYTREATHRRLMQLYYLAGHRTAALRQFEQCASALAREFNVTPTQITLTMAEQIRADQLDKGAALANNILITPMAEAGLLQRVLAELRHLHASLDALHREVETLKKAGH